MPEQPEPITQLAESSSCPHLIVVSSSRPRPHACFLIPFVAIPQLTLQVTKLMSNLLSDLPQESPVLDATQRQALIAATQARLGKEALLIPSLSSTSSPHPRHPHLLLLLLLVSSSSSSSSSCPPPLPPGMRLNGNFMRMSLSFTGGDLHPRQHLSN